MAPRGLQLPPRPSQESSRSCQDAFKRALRALKTTSNSLRERSGRSQEPASLHQEGSRSSSGASGGLQEPTRSFLEASEHIQELSKNGPEPGQNPAQSNLPFPKTTTAVADRIAEPSRKTRGRRSIAAWRPTITAPEPLGLRKQLLQSRRSLRNRSRSNWN